MSLGAYSCLFLIKSLRCKLNTRIAHGASVFVLVACESARSSVADLAVMHCWMLLFLVGARIEGNSWK